MFANSVRQLTYPASLVLVTIKMTEGLQSISWYMPSASPLTHSHLPRRRNDDGIPKLWSSSNGWQRPKTL